MIQDNFPDRMNIPIITVFADIDPDCLTLFGHFKIDREEFPTPVMLFVFIGLINIL